MAINFEWMVSSMEEYPTTSEGLNDVVFIVHWRRTATQVVGDKTYTAETYSSLNVPAPSPDDFTPYEDLTFEQVCGWLNQLLDVQTIDASLEQQIENEISPKVVSLPLPWSQNI